MRKRCVMRLLSMVFLSGLLIFLAGFAEPCLAAGSNTVSRVLINGTPYERSDISDKTIRFNYIKSLNYTFKVDVDVTGYDSYRAQLSIADAGKGNLETEIDVSGSSVTFAPYTFSSDSMAYDICIELYGLTGDTKTLLDTVDFTLDLGKFDITGPQLISKSPADGSKNVDVGAVIEAVFQEELDAGTVTVSNIYLSGKSCTVSLSSDGKKVTLKPQSPLAYNTPYTVNITSGIRDLAGNLASAAKWTFTTTYNPAVQPVIENRQPSSGAINVPVNTNIVMTLSKPLNVTSVDSSGITLKKGSTVVPATIIPVKEDASGKGKITIDPVSSLDYASVYTVQITSGRIKDINGLTLGAATWSFTTEKGAQPTIDTRYPSSGATNIPVGATVTVKFSKAMNSSTINGNNIYLTKSGSKIRATVSYNSTTRTASVKPSSNLSYSTAYYVNLTSGIKDTTGNALQQTNWKFTTGSSDSAQVSSKNPADNAKNVPLDKVITFKFSRSMNSSSINKDNIYLKRSGSTTKLSASVKYDSGTRIVTLTPANDLRFDTEYTVFVTDNVKDSNRQEITPVEWSFTTISEDDLHIVDRDPEPNDTGFPLDGKITIKFSEGLKSSSVTTSTVYLRKSGSTSKIRSSVQYSSSKRTITLTPNDPLKARTEYVVYLTSGLKDLDGRSFTATNWKFETKKEAVSVTNFQPKANQTGVSVDQNITCTFSGKMKSDSINSYNIYLKKYNSNDVIPAVVSYNSSTYKVTLDPKESLDYGTKYTVYLTKLIKDTNGDSISPVSWSFTTERFTQVGTPDRPLVKVNGKYIVFTDAYPYVKSNRVMIPFRALFEALKASVDYSSAQKKVTAKLDGNTVVLYIGKIVAYKNSAPITLDVPPVAINGRTMIPLRFAGEALGANVHWDQNARTVIITTK